MQNEHYEVMNVEKGCHVKMWTCGVPVEDVARKQLANIAKMPFIYKHVAVMPDVHLGKGSTIGSVIPTKGAIIPAAVGVDIGGGMMACKTTLGASDLPDSLGSLRAAIEKTVPHGMSPRRGGRDKGSWATPPTQVDELWAQLAPGFQRITQKYSRPKNTNNYRHLGTLGSGNHFVEVCLDKDDCVWLMLHSGGGNAFRRKGVGYPQGHGTRGPGRAWHYSRLHGCTVVHCPWQGKCRGVRELQSWCGPCHVAQRSKTPLHRRGPSEGDRRCRVPKGRGCH